MDEKELETLRTLFVKLKPVFLSDIYIIRGRYVISGEKSNTEVSGNYLCILEEKYRELIQKKYGEQEIIYIDNLIKIKDDMDSHFRIITMNKEKILKSLEEVLSVMDSVKDWESISEKYEDISEVLFKEKHNYYIEIKREKEEDIGTIVVGKSTFPTITEKSMKKVSCNITYLEEEDLYRLTLKYNHTHFQLMMVYFAIPMKHYKIK